MSSFSNAENPGNGNGNNYRRRSSNARGRANVTDGDDILFFDKGILESEDIQAFREQYEHHCRNMYLYTTLSSNHMENELQNANESLAQILRGEDVLNGWLSDIIDQHVLNSNIDPRHISHFSNGATGKVSNITNARSIKGSDCMIPSKQMIIKQFPFEHNAFGQGKMGISIFKILQECYIQRVLSMSGATYQYTNGRKNVTMNVVPMPTCIRKTQSQGYVVYMEKVEGTDMFTVIADHMASRTIPKNDDMIYNVLTQLSRYLEDFQRQYYFIHNDLNMNNIMIHRSGNIHIIDFGMSAIQIDQDHLVTSDIRYCPSKFWYDNSLNGLNGQPLPLNAVNFYYDHSIAKRVIGPDAVNILDIIYRSQDLFYMMNHLILTYIQSFMGMCQPIVLRKIQNKQPTQQVIYDILWDLSQKRYDDNVSDQICTKQFLRELCREFYQYTFGNPTSSGTAAAGGTTNRSATIDVMDVILKQYLWKYAQYFLVWVNQPRRTRGPYVNFIIEFKYSQKDGIDFVMALAIPVCEEVMRMKGVRHSRESPEWNRMLFVEVYHFIHQFRGNFIPETFEKKLQAMKSRIDNSVRAQKGNSAGAPNQRNRGAAAAARPNASAVAAGAEVNSSHSNKKGSIRWGNHNGNPLSKKRTYLFNQVIDPNVRFTERQEIQRPSGPGRALGKNPNARRKTMGSLRSYETNNLATRSREAQVKRLKRSNGKNGNNGNGV